MAALRPAHGAAPQQVVVNQLLIQLSVIPVRGPDRVAQA
jgi:hypothetical protein